MRNEHGPLRPLEQSCLEPGHWIVEGYDVRHAGKHWIISFCGSYVSSSAPTLAMAREQVRELLEQEKTGEGAS